MIGSGPIVIGQACEFDYSGTQSLKALKEEGYDVVLVNSNPATVMTDPEFAYATYIEPLTCDSIRKIIAKERPDAVLPTMGGQTALNLALELHEAGVLQEFNCKLIGAEPDAIKMAEDRELFRRAMDEIGVESPKSHLATTLDEARKIVQKVSFPLVLRPSRTLGGTGGGIVYSADKYEEAVIFALSASPVSEVLIEESLLGWKEIELEVMRDLKDNVVIICSIENIDPMGVHTGDSITVAPVQTLTDKEYQELRDQAIKIVRKIGVETGGCNVQFAINPANGRIVVIEMNPRVSRSSALASKATGFPIAKLAAKLAVGYTLDELSNDITQATPACFEPAIDYTVIKIPRFNFDKFPNADDTLGTQMKSVGEVLAFGRSFEEALQKAICSLELGSYGFDIECDDEDLAKLCQKPSARRLWYVGEAFRSGMCVDEVYELCKIDKWFLEKIKGIIGLEESLKGQSLADLDSEDMRLIKSLGFADRRLAVLLNSTEVKVREQRERLGIRPRFLQVDTCAGEFRAETPYYYSSYDVALCEISKAVQEELNAEPHKFAESVMILGSGPNRIGQGVEFDYCSVHGVLAIKELGLRAIIVNSNPETVSTDYDISDALYFEPLTNEHVMNVVARERKLCERINGKVVQTTLKGVVLQFGGQTPLKLKLDAPVLGTSQEAIDCSEDRKLFSALLSRLGMQQPEFEVADSCAEAVAFAGMLKYPVMVRPSFVLGGQRMRVVYNENELLSYLEKSEISAEEPLLLDRFLFDAIEVDVDVVANYQGGSFAETEIQIVGVMEHIERTGVHSGDSACVLPPYSLEPELVQEIKAQAKNLAYHLKIQGMLNVQFAVTKEGVGKEKIFIIEANPRASRTVPFVSKATGVPVVKVAMKGMLGRAFNLTDDEKSRLDGQLNHFSVKESVFPFQKFRGQDPVLGPEMKSTGEVMGIGHSIEEAFLKAIIGAGHKLPKIGGVFVSISDAYKEEFQTMVPDLIKLGFNLYATKGTKSLLDRMGIPVILAHKVADGIDDDYTILNLLEARKINLIINTPGTVRSQVDSRSIRVVARELGIPTFTTLALAKLLVKSLLNKEVENDVINLQSLV